MANSLIGKTILVTRPEGQNQKLCELLSHHGATVIAFPTIEIQPLKDQQDYANLEQFDWVIFTSANAVKCSIAQLKLNYPDWPNSVQIAAIGSSTKKIIKDHQLPCHFSPASNFNSESLLNSNTSADLSGKKILIITGKNGRQYLKQQLEAQGAVVTEQFCYERRVPNYPASAIIRLTKIDLDFVVCTSNSGLENLAVILKEQFNTEFQIIGFSKRIIPLATELGLKKAPIITTEASDESVVEAVLNNN